MDEAPKQIEKVLSCSRINRLVANKIIKNIIALRIVTLPLGIGRSLVRDTCESIFLSIMSFQVQPALLIRMAPRAKIPQSLLSGIPSVARLRLHKHGQSKSHVPVGLSKRASDANGFSGVGNILSIEPILLSDKLLFESGKFFCIFM